MLPTLIWLFFTVGALGAIAQRADRKLAAPIIGGGLAYLALGAGLPWATDLAPNHVWSFFVFGGVVSAGWIAMPRRRRFAQPLPAEAPPAEPPKPLPEVRPVARRATQAPPPEPDDTVRADGPKTLAEALRATTPRLAPPPRPAALETPDDTSDNSFDDEYDSFQTEDELPAPPPPTLGSLPPVPATEPVPFKSPSHGRISGARLRDGIARTVHECAAAEHLEIPGFGAFSARQRSGVTTVVFHDDSGAELQLAGTAFADALSERLGATAKTSANAATKFFTAILDQTADDAWVSVDGLGLFGRPGGRKVQFVAVSSEAPSA